VRITGSGALFNNDPAIVPPGLPPVFSTTPNRGLTAGYDAYVGYNSSGTMEVTLGGRAEIQDAVAVGLLPGAEGFLKVDGTGSFLQNGGFAAGTGPTDEVHHFSVGQYGIGQVEIRNGGQVVSRAPENASAVRFGAAIGGTVAQATSQSEDLLAGGHGSVLVDGPGSRWTIGGGLQLGAFAGGTGDPQSDPEDIDGALAVYENQVGHGTLTVSNGGRVSIVSPDTTVADPFIRFQIGGFGILNLQGGEVMVGDPVAGQPPAAEGRGNHVELVNDGVIQGSGRIDTGLFRNRYQGRVSVGAGESLTVAASGEFEDPTDDIPPLLNYGLIEAIGTAEERAELVFERVIDPDPAVAIPLQRFQNLPLATPPPAPAFDGGIISAQHATLRFKSGIENSGVMGFTAGSNVIEGEVANVGQFIINGPETVVVFEDDLSVAAQATITLEDGGDFVVLDLHSFTVAGEVSMDLSIQNSSSISIAGDVGIGGPDSTLNLSLDNDLWASLTHNTRIEILSFGGEAFGVDLTDPLRPIPDANPLAQNAAGFTQITGLPDADPSDPDIDIPDPNMPGQYLNAFTQRIDQAIYLAFFNPSQVGMGAVGADFNGDGIVDSEDLDILLANYGTSMASILQGDANGDGFVDGLDLIVWNNQMGGPGMGSGAGAGAGSGFGTGVPEPSAMGLLATGWLALIASRRRNQRHGASIL